MSSQTSNQAQVLSFPVLAAGIDLPDITSHDLLHSAVHPVRSDLDLVEKRLRTMLESKVEGVPEMMAYLIESGGKRVRPLLACLVARACGYQGADHIPVACVSELLHTATLYHDDVVDEASLRRGRMTANHLFGNKITVLAGDLMLANCFSMLMDGGYFAVSRMLSRTVKVMVEGEILQLRCEENYDTTVAQYLEVIENKTASLFSWCAQASALMAGASVDRSKILSKLGHHTGIAFQLVDDYMDFVGTTHTMGKEPWNDLRQGKITLPLLLAIQQHPSLKADLEKRHSDAHWPELYAKLKKHLAEPLLRKQCEDAIQEHIQGARLCLNALPVSPYRTSILSLLEYLARRDR